MLQARVESGVSAFASSTAYRSRTTANNSVTTQELPGYWHFHWHGIELIFAPPTAIRSDERSSGTNSYGSLTRHPPMSPSVVFIPPAHAPLVIPRILPPSGAPSLRRP